VLLVSNVISGRASGNVPEPIAGNRWLGITWDEFGFVQQDPIRWPLERTLSAEREAIFAALLDQIGAWIAANFGLPPTKQLPDVKFVPQSRLIEIRYRDRQQAQKMSGVRRAGTSKGANAIVALYDASGPTIYVTNEWRDDNPADMSVLVHEMVHHLQHAWRLHFDCLENRERLAYAAQDRWLVEHGLTLTEAFGVDSFTVLARSTCSL